MSEGGREENRNEQEVDMKDFFADVEFINEDAAIFAATGALDATNASDIEDCLNQLFSSSRYKVAVEFKNLEYISSLAIGVFVKANTTAKQNGGMIVLVNPKEDVMEVFDQLGISSAFKIATSRRQALRFLGGAKKGLRTS